MPDPLPLGIFTTDERLVVRAWDAWVAEASGIAAEHALDRPLADLIPDLGARGILQTFERVLTRGTVEVLAPALHHYLLACPPRPAVPGFTRMRQHVTIGPLREDSRTVGVIVTIEDVTARVARERQLAGELQGTVQQGGDGSPRPPWSASPPAAETITRLLGDADWHARRTAVAALAAQGDAVVEALVETLRTQHRDLAVLSSALDLLAISDIDVIAPLVRFLESADANLRIQAALILGERHDPRAVDPLISRLDDPDENVRFHAIEALGRLQAREAAEALLAIAEGGEFFLAFPAIQALGRAGHPAMAPRLVPLLADDLLRTPVIELLGALGDEDSAAPLVDLLNTSEAPAEVVADALAGLHDRYARRYGTGEHIAGIVGRRIMAPGTQRLLDAIQRVGADRLTGLARVLGWLEGEAVQRALTRLLGHDAVRAQVVEALVRHGSGVVALLLEQLDAEDLEVRQAAAVALGRIGDRRATAALVSALRDPEMAVPAAGALARIGDRDAFDGLLGLLGHADPAVRQAAIAALSSIGHPEMPDCVRRLLGDGNEVIRESALRIAGYFAYGSCLEPVLACCRDAVEAVRRAAVEALPFFDDPRAVAALVEALADRAPGVRAAAAAALARTDPAAARDPLTTALADPDAWVRYAALRALGSIGHAAVVPAVIDALRDDPAPQVRLAAVDALGRLRAAESLGVLEPLTRAADPDLADAAIRAVGHIDRPDALAVLERLLRAAGARRRAAAVAALTVRGETRIPELLQWVAAADDDRDVAAASIEGLSAVARRHEAQGSAAVRALVVLTSEPSRREAAIAALSELPFRRIDEVAAGLRDPAPDIRCSTVEALGRMRQSAASRAIEAALDDIDVTVRLAAIRELKQLGSRNAQRRLLTMARTDPDAAVRRAAMLAAASSGEAADLPQAG